MPPPRPGSSRCTNAPAPRSAGWTIGCSCAPSNHGVEVIGYWGEAVTTPAQARALMEKTGARGLAGDLFVDGALGSHTAWLHEPYADAPDRTGTCYLDARRHRSACAGMHRGGGHRRFPRHRRRRGLGGGRRLRASRRRPRRGRRRPVRAPAGAPGDGERGSGRKAGRVGRHRQRAAQFRRALGRRRRHVRPSARRRREAANSTPLRC